jgi:hypothetical protein
MFFIPFKKILLNKAQLYADYIPSYKLKMDMFKTPDYDGWIRPVLSTRNITNISFSLSLMQLIEIVSIYFELIFLLLTMNHVLPW